MKALNLDANGLGDAKNSHMQKFSENFHVDRRLLFPKLRVLAEEMQKRSQKAGYVFRFFELHERLTDEWVKRTYAAYRETWEQQNGSVTPAFIRWVCGRAIIPMINTRESTVLSEVRRRATAQGQQLRKVEVDAWNGRMGRLATKWHDELEAESAALEYRMAKERQTGASPLPERKGSQDAKPGIRKGPSGRRRHNPIDARKELIACLKARGLIASARKVCEGIDKAINTTPISRTTLAPLGSWQNLVPTERTWVGFYDHPKTRNLVRTYVNKVPPLRTAPDVPK